jgi:hypothetical protein
MLFDNLQREKVSKREGYLCFFLSRLSKFSCIKIYGWHSKYNAKVNLETLNLSLGSTAGIQYNAKVNL